MAAVPPDFEPDARFSAEPPTDLLRRAIGRVQDPALAALPRLLIASVSAVSSMSSTRFDSAISRRRS